MEIGCKRPSLSSYVFPLRPVFCTRQRCFRANTVCKEHFRIVVRFACLLFAVACRQFLVTGKCTHRTRFGAAKSIGIEKRARIHTNLIRDYFRKTGAMPTCRYKSGQVPRSPFWITSGLPTTRLGSQIWPAIGLATKTASAFAR